jgi:hypothetical protein
MGNYLKTERILDVTQNSTECSLTELDSIKRRDKALEYLAKIYLKKSDKPLTECDFKNLYDIYYILFTANEKLNMKVTKSKEFVQTLKINPSIIITQFSTLFNS